MPLSEIGTHTRHCALPKPPELVNHSSRLADALASADPHGLESSLMIALLDQAHDDQAQKLVAQSGGLVTQEVTEVV